jgi:hypothetical protein
MKIERKENNGLIEFGSLKCGDVFEDKIESITKPIYMVIEKDNDDYNCVLLESGKKSKFQQEWMVKHYSNAKLVLED